VTFSAQAIEVFSETEFDAIHGSLTSISGITGPPHAQSLEQSQLGTSTGIDQLLKRIFDIIFALTVLMAVFPFFILLTIAMKIDSPGPLFFVQRRIGRNGQYFSCFKLRTMCVDADKVLAELLKTSAAARSEWELDHKLKQDPRVSHMGGIVRKLSLDELPQLINILLGEMSVVGPRPIVQAEVSKYGAFFKDYCSVKPGLTGLWQVSGRNDVTYAERVQFDCDYAKRQSFAFDMWIVAKTAPAVIAARGSY
jgi:exopolysaccharide production protein ExoY